MIETPWLSEAEVKQSVSEATGLHPDCFKVTDYSEVAVGDVTTIEITIAAGGPSDLPL